MTMPLWLAIMGMITCGIIAYSLGFKTASVPIFGRINITLRPGQEKDQISFVFDKELDDILNAKKVALEVVKYTDNSSDNDEIN